MKIQSIKRHTEESCVLVRLIKNKSKFFCYVNFRHRSAVCG